MRAHSERVRDMAVEGLILGYGVQGAAEYARMAPRTLYAWMRRPDFRERLDSVRQRIFETHVSQMAELTGKGIDRLRQILNDDSAGATQWIRACDLIFREARASEVAAIRQRMDEIEARLERFEGVTE